MTKKKGKPLKTQVTLRGRSKTAVETMAAIDDKSEAEVIASIVERWALSEVGQRVLTQEYGLEMVPRRTVIPIDERRRQ